MEDILKKLPDLENGMDNDLNINISDRIKKNYNSSIEVTICCYSILNIDLSFKNDQLGIDYFVKIFFETLEIFLAAVFLLTIPDLATCIRID